MLKVIFTPKLDKNPDLSSSNNYFRVLIFPLISSPSCTRTARYSMPALAAEAFTTSLFSSILPIR
jgi:hypothetical protein